MNTSLLLEKKYKLKQFLNLLFQDEIIEGNNINGSIRLVRIDNQEHTRIDYLKNIDDVVEFTFLKENIYYNTYFNVAITDGAGGKIENILKRNFIALDFDKKDLGADLSPKDIYKMYKSIGLTYQAIVDSGNGYHVYTLIEPTTDINKVEEVTKVLANILGADLKATLKTQILRLPYTFNVKNKNNIKRVKIVSSFKRDEIKYKYKIETLAKKYLTVVNTEISKSDNKAIDYVLNTNKIPNCIAEILLKGAIEGTRHKDIQSIVVTLRRLNKTKGEILYTLKNWNSKGDMLSEKELEYHVNYIYDNVKHTKYNCANCDKKESCFSPVISDFNYEENEVLIKLAENKMRYLKKASRKGSKSMKGNDLLIYCILINNIEGLTVEGLKRELTYKDKLAVSQNTIREILKKLEKEGFIKSEKIDSRGTVKYSIIQTRAKVELTYMVSFGAVYECVKGNITTEELRLYNYMRYLNNLYKRENPNRAKRGNLLQVNQNDLAKDLGTDQAKISRMINNLIDEKIISLWEVNKSKNNGFDYYTYRLNY